VSTGHSTGCSDGTARSPSTSIAEWLLAAVEGLSEIVDFSLMSAVIYTRFARPTTRLVHTAAYLVFACSPRAASRMTLHEDHVGFGASQPTGAASVSWCMFHQNLMGATVWP
jgi:hypothetical protein